MPRAGARLVSNNQSSHRWGGWRGEAPAQDTLPLRLPRAHSSTDSSALLFSKENRTLG